MPWWDAGTFGAVQAVGMANQTRSHFEAMEEMERAAPGSSLRTGWLDRTLGLREAGTAFQAVQIGQQHGGARPSAARRRSWPCGRSTTSSCRGRGTSTERQRWTQALTGLHDGAPAMVGGAGIDDAVGAGRRRPDAGRRLHPRRRLPEHRPRAGAAGRGARHQGGRRTAGRRGRLRRLGHAHRPGHRRCRLAVRQAERAVVVASLRSRPTSAVGSPTSPS